MTQTEAPLRTPLRDLDAAWFDYNGHLNMAYYNVLFDQALDHVFDQIGCGADYRASRDMSFFTAEAHVCYVRELRPGSKVHATVQLMDHDAKRLHVYEELFHADGWLAATSETLLLHIAMAGPKVVAMPDDIAAAISALAHTHANLPRPERVGRSVAIPHRS